MLGTMNNINQYWIITFLLLAVNSLLNVILSTQRPWLKVGRLKTTAQRLKLTMKVHLSLECNWVFRGWYIYKCTHPPPHLITVSWSSVFGASWTWSLCNRELSSLFLLTLSPNVILWSRYDSTSAAGWCHCSFGWIFSFLSFCLSEGINCWNLLKLSSEVLKDAGAALVW